MSLERWSQVRVSAYKEKGIMKKLPVFKIAIVLIFVVMVFYFRNSSSDRKHKLIDERPNKNTKILISN